MPEENQPNLVAQMMQQQLQANQEENALQNESQSDIQNGMENELQNTTQNVSKMPENASNTPIEQEKEVLDNGVENEEENATENDFEKKEEIEEELADNDQNSDTIDIEDEEPEEPIPQADDPLQKMREEPAPSTVGEQVKKATGDSPKNRKTLHNISEVIFEEADIFKAQICSALSGEHTSLYVANQERKKIVIDAVAEWLNMQEVKAPSPFGTLILALGVWLLPSLGTAFYQKYKLKAAQKTTPTVVQPKPATADGEAAPKDEPQAPPYAHLKEYQENRRAFSIHKTKGVYNKLPNGTFCPIATAEEFPSPEIQAMLDEGLTSAQIREKIYT